MLKGRVCDSDSDSDSVCVQTAGLESLCRPHLSKKSPTQQTALTHQRLEMDPGPFRLEIEASRVSDRARADKVLKGGVDRGQTAKRARDVIQLPVVHTPIHQQVPAEDRLLLPYPEVNGD